MPEYRIVTKIDPAPAVQGAQTLKQTLGGVDAAAGKTTATINHMTLAEYKAVKAIEAMALAFGKQSSASKDAEAAAKRVMAAVDQEALATKRLNDLLKDATRAHAAGVITAGQLAKVHTLVAQGAGRVTTSLAQQRAGYTQLGFQIQDITQTMALGINPMVILAQQGGQTASALSLALGPNGAAGKAAAFMAGPFGSIILATTAIVGMMAMKFLASGDAAEEAMEAIKKDAAEAEVSRKAKEVYGHTLEGVTEALRLNKLALDEQADGWKTAARKALEAALAQQANLKGIRAEIAANLDWAESMYEVQKARATGPSQQSELAALNLPQRYATLDNLRKRLASTDAQIAEADRQYNQALAARQVEIAAQMSDPLERIKAKYEGPQGLIALAQRSASAEDLKTGALVRQVVALKAKQKAEEDAYRESQRAARSNGVATFRSREQAIGIAGRELQGAGLRVGENVQFGGVHESHPGMGNAAHGRFAIDVNQGAGVTEANVPNIKARFDALARLYQSRGYRVLWAGQVWEANGNGPTRPIPAGQLQHNDHMHIEAPGTIVGKATQASTAAQELREQGQAATVAEQKADFVQGVVDKAAGRGVPDNRAAKLQRDIAGTLADYQRRFNEVASPDQVAKITGALTEADAREIAEHFRTAYVEPLTVLESQIGKTGLQREIQARIDKETADKGSALNDVERKQIETSVLYGDQLLRMDEILRGINEPLEGYKQQIAALNGLLEKGLINQTSYNALLAGMQAPARDIIGDMPKDQLDPNSGLSYGDLSATLDENARYAQQLADLQTHRQMLLDMNINYNGLEEAAKQEHERRLAAIEQARRSTQIMAASDLFGSLAEITRAGFGEQSAIFKAMFVASKAFAIADSIVKIQQAMASAAMSLPFPANLPAIATVAALGASIIANIMSASLALASGGIVRGPGGPRDDAIPARLSDGEFIVNAAATRRNRALLEAVNNGAVVDRQRRGSTDRLVKETAGGDSMSFSFGDVIVQAGNATGKDAEDIGQATKRAIGALIDEKLDTESRSGGRLTRTPSSVMTS